MKKLIFASAILFNVIFSSISVAQTSNFTVIGDLPCGDILAKKGDKVWMISIFSFMHGYITSRNYEAGFDNLKQVTNVENNSLYFAVVKFCEDNPLRSLGNASEVVYAKLLEDFVEEK